MMSNFLAEHKIVYLQKELEILFFENGREIGKDEGKFIDFEGFCSIILPRNNKSLRDQMIKRDHIKNQSKVT